MMIFVYFRRKGPRVYSGGVEGENICLYVCVCVFSEEGTEGIFRWRRRGEHMYICLCMCIWT